MLQFESVAAKRSECDTAVSHVISGFEELMPSMHSISDCDDAIQSGDGSVLDQSVPAGSNSDSDASTDSEPFLSDSEAAVRIMFLVTIIP